MHARLSVRTLLTVEVWETQGLAGIDREEGGEEDASAEGKPANENPLTIGKLQREGEEGKEGSSHKVTGNNEGGGFRAGCIVTRVKEDRELRSDGTVVDAGAVAGESGEDQGREAGGGDGEHSGEHDFMGRCEGDGLTRAEAPAREQRSSHGRDGGDHSREEDGDGDEGNEVQRREGDGRTGKGDACAGGHAGDFGGTAVPEGEGRAGGFGGPEGDGLQASLSPSVRARGEQRLAAAVNGFYRSKMKHLGRQACLLALLE